jgi:hypothetical protein
MAAGDKIVIGAATPVDTLASTSKTDALSANQGRVLNNAKIEVDDYATSTVGGTVKARISGSTLYLRIDGNNA